MGQSTSAESWGRVSIEWTRIGTRQRIGGGHHETQKLFLGLVAGDRGWVAALAATLRPQDLPSRPITIGVPFAAGGTFE